MRGIRVVSIDPAVRSIDVIKIGPEKHSLTEFFGERPIVAEKLPRGDVLLATASEYGKGFTVGGSRPIVGRALIVGRPEEWGHRCSALVSLEDVVTMVRWISVERPPERVLPPPPVSVRAIVLDPELGIVEEKVIAAHMPAADGLLGRPHDWHVRLPSGDYLLSAVTDGDYRWWVRLYGELKLIGRCVIVGHDRKTGYFSDVSMKVDHLRKQVEFSGPGNEIWVRYVDSRAMVVPAAE